MSTCYLERSEMLLQLKSLHVNVLLGRALTSPRFRVSDPQILAPSSTKLAVGAQRTLVFFGQCAAACAVRPFNFSHDYCAVNMIYR